MVGENEKSVSVKFCFKAGLSATETLVLVQKANGNEALNRSNVFMWHSRFRDARELVENEERGGCPKSTSTEENIAAVADLVKNDRRVASRLREESLNIPKTSSSDSETGFLLSIFFLLQDNAPSHKAASVCQFFTPKNVTILYHPHALQMYLSQTIFYPPS
jgi:hypothetical protein